MLSISGSDLRVSLNAIETHDVDMVLGSKDNLAISSLSASSAVIVDSAPASQLYTAEPSKY